MWPVSRPNTRTQTQSRELPPPFLWGLQWDAEVPRTAPLPPTGPLPAPYRPP